MGDIQTQGTLVGDVDRQRAQSVAERQYPSAQSYYTTMLELKEAYEQEQAEEEFRRTQDVASKAIAELQGLQIPHSEAARTYELGS